MPSRCSIQSARARLAATRARESHGPFGTLSQKERFPETAAQPNGPGGEASRFDPVARPQNVRRPRLILLWWPRIVSVRSARARSKTATARSAASHRGGLAALIFERSRRRDTGSHIPHPVSRVLSCHWTSLRSSVEPSVSGISAAARWGGPLRCLVPTVFRCDDTAKHTARAHERSEVQAGRKGPKAQSAGYGTPRTATRTFSKIRSSRPSR
jgi:hypothetical protein